MISELLCCDEQSLFKSQTGNSLEMSSSCQQPSSAKRERKKDMVSDDHDQQEVGPHQALDNSFKLTAHSSSRELSLSCEQHPEEFLYQNVVFVLP